MLIYLRPVLLHLPNKKFFQLDCIILFYLQIGAVILTPTRELAVQINEVIEMLTQDSSLRYACL